MKLPPGAQRVQTALVDIAGHDRRPVQVPTGATSGSDRHQDENSDSEIENLQSGGGKKQKQKMLRPVLSSQCHPADLRLRRVPCGSTKAIFHLRLPKLEPYGWTTFISGCCAAPERPIAHRYTPRPPAECIAQRQERATMRRKIVRVSGVAAPQASSRR